MRISVLDTLFEQVNQSVFQYLQEDYRFIKAIAIHESCLFTWANLEYLDTYKLLNRTKRRRMILHVSLSAKFESTYMMRLSYIVDEDKIFIVTMLSDHFEIVIFDINSHERI